MIVVPKLTVGGTERHILAVLPRLDRRRFTVEVATTRGAGQLDDALRAGGVKVLAAPALFQGRANVLVAGPWLWWHLIRTRPDLIHFLLPEAYIVGGLAALLAGSARRVVSRRSLNIYQSDKPLIGKMEGWLHKRMDAVVGNSRAVIEQLAAEGAPAGRLALIYNGIDVDAFARDGRDAARAALGLAAESLVLVIVATLLPYKGHADLVAALARIAERLPADWQLLVAGRDEGIGEDLRTQAEAAGLAGHIRWLGETDDVPRLLAASDVAVLASHEEGFPNAVLEAMAAGLPVVATDVGGCREAVLEGVTGRLVPAHDPAALGQAILELGLDPERRAAMGAAARLRVVEHYSIETCVAAYESLYEAVLRGAPLPAAQPSCEGPPSRSEPADGARLTGRS